MKQFFLEPTNAAQRQYEAFRAHFVDGLSQADAAKKFGYSPGSFRVMLHKFRREEHPRFFIESRRKTAPPKARDPQREQIIALRKQNLSVYDIADRLQADNQSLSPPTISKILSEEGFAKLPRRRDDERPDAGRPQEADKADRRFLNLADRSFHTKFGGLFLFIPYIVKSGLDQIVDRLGFPGSEMVPAAHAVRSLLALKLFGNARHQHVMSDVFDQGLALFSGLNVIPKSSFLTQYSCRIDPDVYPRLLRTWFDAVKPLGWSHGTSFDLDFHTIPFHGHDALVEKHYVSKRSRRQKGLLAFVVSDAENRAFCYADADVHKNDMNDQVIAFTDFWKEKTGHWPKELVFDSRFTTYANLNVLNQRGIQFITLRRRSQSVMNAIAEASLSAWRKLQLKNVARAYRTPRVLETTIQLRHYQGDLRQLAVKDLGHDDPTILITNQSKLSATTLIQRYAQRMIIENNIADSIDFFHMDALSSVVALKVNCDLMLTLIAGTLYRLLAKQIGERYPTARYRKIFRDFINATARVTINGDQINIYYQKRAHNPFLIRAGFHKDTIHVPWLDNKILGFHFG